MAYHKPDKTVRVLPCDVAGQQPFIDQRGDRGLRIAAIALHHTRSPHRQFSRFPFAFRGTYETIKLN